ncbi:hypothetical protein ACFX13_041014 [Malus domestica]
MHFIRLASVGIPNEKARQFESSISSRLSLVKQKTASLNEAKEKSLASNHDGVTVVKEDSPARVTESSRRQVAVRMIGGREAADIAYEQTRPDHFCIAGT